jgi:peptidoglycan hydrolase-like protein with peptidoglycan-binding domain
MNNSVSDSLNKIRLIESPTTAAAPVATKAGGKLLGKVIPGAGAALGAYDAANRLKAGDKTGAAIAGITGAASMIPGIGTGAAILGTGIQAARDKWRTGSWLPDDEQVAAAAAKDQPAAQAAAPAPAVAQPKVQVPPGGDPKVFALQQQLIAKGAKIKADGKMGPATQAAMKQFPGVQLASKENKVKGKLMSESEKIAALRARLEQIDNPQINENPLSALARFGRGVAGGFSNPKYATVAGKATTGANKGQVVNKAANVGARTGAALGSRTAMAATGAAAGVAGMSALQNKQTPATPPVAGKPATAAPAAPAAAAPSQTANDAPDPKDVEALNAMADELQNSQDPVDIELMKQYNGIINAINNRAKDDKRTQGEIAASADMSTGPM